MLKFECQVPEFITKFYDKDAQGSHEAGSFKVTTLVKCQSGEQHRFTDKDGLQEMTVNVKTKGYAPIFIAGAYDLRGPNMTIKDGRVRKQFNEYIFCACAGPYDQAIHEALLQTDPTLTHYCVINARAFLDAAMVAMAGHPAYTLGQPPIPPVSGFVHYGKRNIDVRASAVDGQQVELAHFELWYRTIFTKPVEYRHEHEYRIVFPTVNGNVDPTATPVFLKSTALRETIIRFGKAGG